LRSNKPKLAIIIADLGLNAKLTRTAQSELPAEVSLAYAAVAKRLKAQMNDARRAGHEVFLQMPMEPWGYPQVNPGPDTLLADAPPKRNMERLHRLLARGVGYAGVMTYAGQKLLQKGEALSPILHELKRRGLLAVDDATVANSLLPSLGLVVGLPVLRADVRLPPNLPAPRIRAVLQQAADLARRNGQALLVVSASRETLRELQDWLAPTLAGNEILLVPATALARLQEKRAP